MFDGFVDASVTAIESRDPDHLGPLAPGGDHVRRSWPKKVDGVSDGPFADVHFTPTQLQQTRVRGRAARLRQGRRAREGAGQGQEALRGGSARHQAALRLHQEGARGGSRGAQAARGDGARQARAAGRGSPHIDAELGRRMDELDEALAFVNARQRADRAGSGRLRAAGRDRPARLPGARRRAAPLPGARGGGGAAGATRQPDRRRAGRDREPRHAHHEVPAGDPLGPALRRRAAHRGRAPRVLERQRLPAPPAAAGTSRSNRAS